MPHPVSYTHLLTYLRGHCCAEAFMNLNNDMPTAEDALLLDSFCGFIQQHDFSKLSARFAQKRERRPLARRLCVVYAVMLLTAAGIWLGAKTFPLIGSHPVAITPENMVYITTAGNKYHRRDCYQIDDSQLLVISIEDAARLGYEPCKTCRPQE